MRVGIDSYSYHRRYGEIRPGEMVPHERPWPLGPSPVLDHARMLGVDDLMLETCFLPGPDATDGMLADEAGAPTLGFSWGHPWPPGAFHGLEGGRSRAAEDDLARWIGSAGSLGHGVMRITLGSPVSRGDDPGPALVARLVDPVRRAADRAAELGLALAVENHGDLSVAELAEVIARVDRPNIGVTLDNVNLIRLGDDMVEGTRVLAPATLIVQLKDHEPADDPNIPGGPVCTALGEGVAPLDDVLDVLGSAGFEGPVCVEIASLGPGEVDELAMIERSIAWLRERI